MNLARLAVHATRPTAVGDEIQLVADDQRRRRVRRVFCLRPGHVLFREIALAVGTDRQQAGVVVSRREEDQAVSERGPRDKRITIISDAPNLISVGRIVGTNAAAGRTDDLLLVLQRDYQRRAEREQLLMFELARRLP